MRKLILLLLPFVCFIASCSDDKDEDSPAINNLQGSWAGCHAYRNPVSGLKKNYLYVTFTDGNSGEVEYEGQSVYSYGLFTYNISGNKIICKGVWADSDEYVDLDFTMTLEIQGDRLIPLDRYKGFILTRDGSVTTDSNGMELVDKSDLIIGVWKIGDVQVVEFTDDSQYTIYNMSGSSYSTKETGDYTYDYLTKRIWLGINVYDILRLDTNSMVLRSSSDKEISLSRGDASDIPEEVDIKGLLTSHLIWTTSDNRYSFAFLANGNTTFIEETSVLYGSIGYITLKADGTYYTDGHSVTCNYSDIWWNGGNTSKYADMFPGWTCGGSRTVTYKVSEYSESKIRIVTPDGYEYILKPA